MNDINMLDYTVFLLALVAADTAMALSLVIVSRGLSGRLSVRNNVSNYSSYLLREGYLFYFYNLYCLDDMPGCRIIYFTLFTFINLDHP